MKFLAAVMIEPGHDIRHIDFTFQTPTKDAARYALHKAMEQLGFQRSQYSVADIWLDMRK